MLPIDGQSLQRELARDVALSIDNLVSLKEKQLMESASQRADELDSATLFPILGLNRIRGYRSIDASALLILNSEEFVTAHTCWFYFPLDSVHCLLHSVSRDLLARCARYICLTDSFYTGS